MSSPPTVPTVFITGATGSQGSHLVRFLRSPPLNWTVHATVRDPTTAPAKLLSSLGVHLTTATWDDTAALTAALSTCTHLFLNTVPSLSNIPHEHIQTTSILTIALAAGVTHVVYSSGLAIDRLSEVSVFDPNTIVGQTLLSKLATEKTLKSLPFQHWTILRGASFMQNYLAPKVFMYGPSFARDRLCTMALNPTDILPIVDTADIAKFAVAAFQDPVKFHRKEVSIAGDELSIDEITRQLSEAIGEDGKGPIRYVALSEEEIATQRATNPFIVGQLATKELIKFVKAEETRGWGIELSTFREFLGREREAVRATYCGGIRMDGRG